jgi:hypothetical protein
VNQLTDLYQQQLAELSACHSLLQTDQERLAEMLAPYVSSDGRLSMNQPDPKVILFKQGLDLRMKEFEDDCRRIQKTERRLQSKIDEATVGFESQFAEASGLADKRVLKRISEQQRIIEAQQIEMDQLRFERDVLKDETRRLQALARQEPPKYSQVFNRGGGEDTGGIPDLHGLREGRRQQVDDRIKFPQARGAGVGRRDGSDMI